MAVQNYGAIMQGAADLTASPANAFAQGQQRRQAQEYRNALLAQDQQAQAFQQQKYGDEMAQADAEDVEWDDAFAQKDWARMARVDPQTTKILWEQDQASQPAAPVTEQALPSGRVLAMQGGKPVGAPWAKPEADTMSGHGAMQEPFDVQTYRYFLQQPQEVQAKILEYRRGNSTPEIAADIASAKTTATERAKVKVGAQTDLPRVDANAEQMLENLDAFEQHKGTRFLYGGYGVAPIVPGTPQADAAAILEQIGGKAFLEAFNSLKGGGQITEKEGEKATAAITRLGNRKQSFAGAKQAVAELRAIVKAGAVRARKKASAAPVAGGAASDNDPLGIR
jgi:hypothetical protein